MFTRRVWLAVVVALSVAGISTAADKKMSFEVYQDAKDEFRWRLKDGEGSIVATSGQGYGKKADCTKMVGNFQEDISKYTFEVYEDNKKDQRFRLKAKNGNVVGSSNGSYKTKAEAETAIKAIQKGAKDAKVVELEKEKDKN